jgi:hypothetical protein
MIKPAFPFKEKQIILTSNRVMIHSNSDAIFLFGKGAVSLSSPQTINLDSKERVLINSPKIELGRRFRRSYCKRNRINCHTLTTS